MYIFITNILNIIIILSHFSKYLEFLKTLSGTIHLVRSQNFPKKFADVLRNG